MSRTVKSPKTKPPKSPKIQSNQNDDSILTEDWWPEREYIPPEQDLLEVGLTINVARYVD